MEFVAYGANLRQWERNAQIHRLIEEALASSGGLGVFLITRKAMDARRRGANEGNAADDALMVD